LRPDDEQGYLDKYSIRESIEDETTLPIRHTMAPSEMTVPTEQLAGGSLAFTQHRGELAAFGLAQFDMIKYIHLGFLVGAPDESTYESKIRRCASFQWAYSATIWMRTASGDQGVKWRPVAAL
jgi:hypothetical protein